MADGLVILDGVGAIGWFGFDEVDQDAGAFDVSEELVAEAGAGAGAFDQAGDVGHDEGAVEVELDDAEVGRFGGEGVVGDQRAGAGDAGEERALAGVGFAHQADVGDQLQLERDAARLGFAAGGVLAGGLVGGAFEAGVSLAAASAAGGDDALARRGQVFEDVAVNRVADDGAGWDAEEEVFGAAAVAVGAAAVLAALGAPAFAMGEGGEAVDAGLGHQDDAAAVAAVAAVGPAAGDVLLAAEAHAAVAATAGFDIDCHAIDEHGRKSQELRA